MAAVRRIEDLDALFDFSSDDEPKQIPMRKARSGSSSSESDPNIVSTSRPDQAANSDDNGLDPIKEVKRRPKIDADRLLGPTGFPNLIERSRKWKFASVNSKERKKNDTMKDMKSLLYEYELWCHKFFPKNKFEDTVKLVEKVCRTRRVQSALSDWKNTEKDKRYKPQDAAETHSNKENGFGESDDGLTHSEQTRAAQASNRDDSIFESSPAPRNLPFVGQSSIPPHEEAPDEFPDEDEWKEMQEMEEQHLAEKKQNEAPLFIDPEHEDEIMP